MCEKLHQSVLMRVQEAGFYSSLSLPTVSKPCVCTWSAFLNTPPHPFHSTSEETGHKFQMTFPEINHIIANTLVIPLPTGVSGKRDYRAWQQERGREWTTDGRSEAFCFELSGRHECLCRSFTNVHTHTINVATLPGLTFTGTWSQPVISDSVFHFPILTHRSLSLSLFHSSAHDPTFSRPGWLPLCGGS